ncbi:MAG: endonuclease III [Planctomycetaceae bacterium]|nr:endonuclease III [Planctomycetaceae bacterium]
MAKRRSSNTGLPADVEERAKAALRVLKKHYPIAECALNHESPYELLVATILSAQCTDARVNLVTPALFLAYPNAATLAKARQDDVEKLIRSTGFFRNKAANLIGMAKGVVEKHNGEIPASLEDLVQLPGVGRKTANVVLGTAMGIASGVVVDTHVTRLSNHLGWTTSRNAERIEQDLMALFPKRDWIGLSHRLIHHGRQICIARRPKCHECPLLPNCPRVGLPDLEPAAVAARGAKLGRND